MPEDYGYQLDNKKGLIPTIIADDQELLPNDFPKPCSCLKCARKNVCPCRVCETLCCEFCNCRGICKNKPLNV